MRNTEQISDFLLYNYLPFNKKQCIMRNLTIWVTSLILCFAGCPTVPWVLIIGIIDIILSVIFLLLILKYSQSQISRYLCDGLFWLYIAVFFNLASYRLLVLQGGSNWVLALTLLTSLVVCILLFTLLTFFHLKSGKYSEKKPSKKIVSLPVFCGAIGVLAARLSLQGASQEVGLTTLAYICLILSFATSIPSVNLLKALFYKRQ